METFIENIFNKFNRPLTSIKDYNTIYEYKGEKYNVNTLEYIYLFLHTPLNISKVYQKYSSVIDSMYSDIFRNKKDNYVEYSQSITIEIKKNKYFKKVIKIEIFMYLVNMILQINIQILLRIF